jgi:hypothetical protein
MSTYYPDRWEVVSVVSESDTYYRVLSSGYGGFGGSNSWKLSSGISSIVDLGFYYEFLCESGSTYVCHKESVGTSMYTLNVFTSMQLEASERGIALSLVDSISDTGLPIEVKPPPEVPIPEVPIPEDPLITTTTVQDPSSCDF